MLARSAHSHQRDERSEHFVGAFANLIDARVAQHSFQGTVGEIRGAAVDLESFAHEHPERLSAEHLQHGRLKHVVFETAVDE